MSIVWKSLLVVASLTLMFGSSTEVSAVADSGTISTSAPDPSKLPVFPITVFAPPSYSTWLPAVIVEKGLDVRHGFKLQVTPKVGQVAYIDFATGTDIACFCIAPTTFTQFVVHGADVTLVWNAFEHNHLVAVTDPLIKTAKDLEGKTVSTNTGSGQWAVTSYLLKQQGVDLSKIKVESSIATSQVPELAAGRVDAIFPGAVEISSIQTQAPNFHTFSIFDRVAWQAYSHSPGIPSIALGVSRSWFQDPLHQDLVRKFYVATLDAVSYLRAHPDEAADIISRKTNMEKAAVLYALVHYPEIIRVGPIGPYKGAIKIITQKLMPEGGQLERPLTDKEVDAYVSNFRP